MTVLRAGRLSRPVCWIAVLATAAVCLFPLNPSAHPLHSEAIERPCALYRQGDPGTLIEGRCSFFMTAGYLIFKLDAPSGGGDRAPEIFSGTINFALSSGSVFLTSGAELAHGPVALAESSPQVVHMQPGTLATWPNGYVLDVGGVAVKADGAVGAVAAEKTETIFETFVSYLEQGFIHIIPRGFDHILFVMGLFLLSPSLKTLLWQVSAFTLAHTVTLALGSTGVVTVPTGIVEPLIALSIVWVAVENLFTDRLHRWRLAVVFGFGLLHGFGFADVLLEIGLSGAHFYAALLAFNLGVELGQLTVILCGFLLFGWRMKKPGYHRYVVVPVSCLIALIGAYWVVERTF